MIKRRGRPIKENAKRHGIRVRLNDEEHSMLKQLSTVKGSSCSDILRDLVLQEYKKVVSDCDSLE